MSVNLTALEAAAHAATPGPWKLAGGAGGNRYAAIVADHPSGFDSDGDVEAYGGHLIGESISTPNRDYMVAANPEVVLELIAMLRKGFVATVGPDWTIEVTTTPGDTE